MGLSELLNGKQIVAVVCNQWGDTGKGKFSDYFASHWADVTARGTGGNNAGHTVVVNGKEKIFHLLPTGITQDSEGKTTILGNGMVIDLVVLCRELDELKKEGKTHKHLMISKDAHVIMPYHIDHDKRKNQSQKQGGIGSTGRGIGPCYADKIARRGITIADVVDKEKLKKKIEKASQFYSNQKIDAQEIINELEPFIEKIKPFVKDTVKEMHTFVKEGKKILIEGAQGLLLSIEHGTYPYVTSSDCSLNGTASGVGIPASIIDLPIGIVKFPFMTRVGAGPFTTEFGGRTSEDYCAEEITKVDELQKHGIPFSNSNGHISYNYQDPKIIEMMNSADEFTKGIGFRLTAGEYGATTGRPRRIGWTDAVAAKYAVNINGPLIILTKADAIAGSKEFKICYGYSNSEYFSKDEEQLKKSKPQYKTYKGYGDISKIKKYEDLPESLKEAIEDFESFTGGKVVAVSVGAEREQTIIK